MVILLSWRKEHGAVDMWPHHLQGSTWEYGALRVREQGMRILWQADPWLSYD